MDEKTFRDKVERLEQIGAVVAKLPPEVRVQAFDLLKAYVGAHERPTKESDASSRAPASHSSPAFDDTDEKERFFSGFSHDKPADNVKLVLAYLFSQFGSQPFQAEEVQALADEVGVTVPSRIDMTVRQATDEGKKLFASTGRGLFKPTVHGEAFLKKEYKVKKGTRPKPASGNSDERA